jgi:hypothetical protein
MSTMKNLIREAVREFMLSENVKDARDFASGDVDMDQFRYMTIARQLVWAYEDGTVAQDVDKLVDNYVKAQKATNGISVDRDKLRDAVKDQFDALTHASNVRTFGGGR